MEEEELVVGHLRKDVIMLESLDLVLKYIGSKLIVFYLHNFKFEKKISLYSA